VVVLMGCGALFNDTVHCGDYIASVEYMNENRSIGG
jgi:hypothetical protein